MEPVTWGNDLLIATGLAALSMWAIVWLSCQERPRHRIPPPPAPSLRHIRLRQNGGSHTAAEWQALCQYYRHRCLACKQQRPLTKDHIVPVLHGGTNDITNIQPLCQSCNSRKGTSIIDYR